MSDHQNVSFGLISGGDALLLGVNQLPDVLGLVQSRLQQAAASHDLFAQVFGDKANTAEIQAVRSQWSVGDFSQLPSVQILSAANTNGAFGAYASSNQAIYLSDALFQSGAAPTNSVLGAVGVLVEETFHWLDDRVGADTQGDEGELGKMLVFGAPMSNAELTRIRHDDDRGFITVNGQRTSAELAFDYAGNSLSTARNINIGSSTTTLQDWVGSTDTNDYYRFNLSYNSTLNLSLNGLSADADVQLLNSSGALIQTSANCGTSAESIIRQLNAGTYYIRVLPYSGSTYYNLNLSAVPDYAGNTLATARNIAVGAGTTTFRDWVGSSDTNDYYRFNLSNTSNFNLSLNGLSADVDVQLLNSSGALIQTSANCGTSAESIIRQLNAGTYYIRVLPWSGSTIYNLNLNLSATVVDDYAGNTATTGLVNIGGSTAGRINFGGDTDWLRVNLVAGTTYQFRQNATTMLDPYLTLRNSAGTALISNDDGGGGNNSLITYRATSTGTYYLDAHAYSSGDIGNYNVSANAISIPTPVPPVPPVPPTPTNWFTQYLRDAGIISLTRSLAADGNLSRTDMISIFRNAEDGSTIDGNELTDLRTIINNSARFTMADSVRVLSNKIAGTGDIANTRSGIGNLSAGGSATQMENLIGKWFLGTDRPTTQYQYRTASGSLYQNGISYQDINQGSLGDCYFLAGLAGVASRTPSAIQNMIQNNNDGTYTFRFYNNGVADYVTVDSYLPTDASGSFVYANRDSRLLYNNSANELWVALAEKAYAQMSESGWINRWNNDHTTSYQTRDASYATNGHENTTGINGGWSVDVLRQVTNQSSITDSSLTDSDRTNIISQFNAGRTVYMNWADHALTLVGYNSSTQQFSIYNPWGTLYNLTWSQILNGGYGGERFTDWSYSA